MNVNVICRILEAIKMIHVEIAGVAKHADDANRF